MASNSREKVLYLLCAGESLAEKNAKSLLWESHSCSTTAPTPASDASVVRVRCVCGSSLMYDSLVKFTSAVFAALNT